MTGPYCLEGVPLGGASLSDCRSSQLSISLNDALDPVFGPVVGPAVGGNPVIVKGYFVLPTDISRRGASGILGAESFDDLVHLNVNSQDMDVQFSSQYLAVSFQQYPKGCRTPGDGPRCQPSDVVETWATDCKIQAVASSGTNTAARTCARWTPPDPVPEIRCIAPPGSSSAATVTIFWHGIPTSLDFVYRYAPPKIFKIVPDQVPVAGNTAITLVGENFGSVASWQRQMSATIARVALRGRVEIISTGPLPCLSTSYVSDSQVICVVPALKTQRQRVQEDRSVAVQVVVNTGNQRSSQTAASVLRYTDVPMYYNCDNHRTSKSDCFVCCRSACIVDEFALGAKRGGQTYRYCDTSCHRYCGFIPSGSYQGLGRSMLFESWSLLARLVPDIVSDLVKSIQGWLSAPSPLPTRD